MCVLYTRRLKNYKRKDAARWYVRTIRRQRSEEQMKPENENDSHNSSSSEKDKNIISKKE